MKKAAIEYVFWPGELVARAVEHVGATTLRVIQGIPHALDSYRRGKDLEENYIPNELETLKRDLQENGHKPVVARLDAQRIADLVWADYTRRQQGGEWLSPDYLAQVGATMADCAVPPDAMLDTFANLSKMSEPPARVQLAPVPKQLALS